MNFNDKMQYDQNFVLRTQQDQPYEQGVLHSSDSQNRIQMKSKPVSEATNKISLPRGKQNDSNNITYGNNKNVITNHSFNGFFNQNNNRPKKNINQSINKKHDFKDFSQQNYQVNSPTNFNSTGKLSNLQFVSEQSKTLDYQQSMHSQVKNFMKKYFPDNYRTNNFYQKYVTINELVETLFEEFQNLIGKQNIFNLLQPFNDKVFLIFGERVYFDDFFDKTFQIGLTGLILQILKSIKQDQNQNQQSRQIRSLLKPTQTIQPKKSFSKNMFNSNINHSKNYKNNNNSSYYNQIQQNSKSSRCTTTTNKISLDKFFGNSLSRIQHNQIQQQYMALNDTNTNMNQQHLQQLKRILQEYIQNMYQQAQTKLNKKYTQQMKKVTLKYKQTQKLLQKINQKISNHYDTLHLEKQYEKKIKAHLDKQNQLNDKIKQLQYSLKSTKDDVQKQKMHSFKLDQEIIQLKSKLQKYQNAIFQKAMEKGSNQNSISGSSTILKDTKTNSTYNYSQQNIQPYQQIHNEKPKFQVKIDTITQHRTVPVVSQTTYVPCASRYTTTGLTPTRIRQMERAPSVSPIKQRISFVKTQNPSLNSRITVTPGKQNINNQNSRITYKPLYQNDNLKTSTVQKIQVGQKIQLRPLSPIGKLTQINLYNNGNPIINQNGIVSSTISSVSQNIYGDRSKSPIKVQFCTSRVTTVPTQNR